MENLNIKVFMNVGEASAFLEQECFHIPILMDITNAYKGTFGGCSCNRARRVANANNVYKLKAMSPPPAQGPTEPMRSALTIGNVESQTAYLINDKATPPTNPLKNALTNSVSSVIIGDAKYLRWEGVWDGYSATPEKAPGP